MVNVVQFFHIYCASIGSLVADLNLEELLRDGSDFLLPEDFQDELLAFESATPAAYTAVSAQPISDTFISRGAACLLSLSQLS